MKAHVAILVLALCGSCSLEKNGESTLIHRLRKRQVSAEDLGPIPYRARDPHAPLPYQQQNEDSDSDSSSSSSSSSSRSSSSGNAGAAAAGAENRGPRIENDDPRASRDYQSSGYGGYVDYSASSVSSQSRDQSSSSGDSHSRPYYQYQPPISSGHRSPASQGNSSSSSQSAGRRFLGVGYSHPSLSGASSSSLSSSSSNGNRDIPSQSYVAGNTRHHSSQQVSVQGGSGGSGGSGGGGGSGGDEEGSDRRPVGLVRQDLASRASADVASNQQPSISGDEEPRVQVFPSERPVVDSQSSQSSQYQQQLRQREQERQRRLQQRQQQLAARAAAGGRGGGGGGRVASIGGRESGGGGLGRGVGAGVGGGRVLGGRVYPGSQYPVGGVNFGQPVYYSGQQQYGQQQYRQQYGQQGRQGRGGYAGGVGGGAGGGGGRVLQPLYSQGQRVVYGGGVGGGGGGVSGGVVGGRQPYYYSGGNYGGYSQGGGAVNAADYDSECPNTGIRIQINGIPCEQAVDHYGSYLCYRHEYTSRECCLRCRGLKNPARVGCEYGDHSGRCQQLQPFDCYDLRNRQSCCQSCERMRVAGARSGCEYGDMTPNCDQVRQNPGLCYVPENRYLCCQTCNTIRVTQDPECPWGDQNADLCQPFDQAGGIRINCYAAPIKRICCQACRRLEEWIPMNQPGCEYGDRPVTFNTGSHRNLNCTSFVRYYGYDQCNLNQAVATNCCYTCHRYTQG